jgi:hypothetical protein
MANLQDQDQEVPDFMSDMYMDAREALKARIERVTDAIAAESLKVMWEAKCAADERARQQQQAQHDAAAAERTHLEKEAEQLAIAAEKEEHEAARKEEEKKHKAKFLPVAVGHGLPDEIPIEVPPTVLRRLVAAKLVGLWHFTDNGIRHGSRDVSLVDDDALRLVDDGEGNVSFVKDGSKKALETRVADQDLSWEEVTVAILQFLRALVLAGWPEDRRQMFSRFFGAIQVHRWRTETDPDGIKRHALLIYMAEQRKLWHQFIEARGAVFAPNISILNEEALRRAKDEAYDHFRRRLDKKMELRVSTNC